MSVPISSDPIRDRALSIEPMSGGTSGAIIERLVLEDGRSLIRKSFSAASDWMMRATRDRGRAATLWVSGAMDRLPPSIDPAIVAIERLTEDGWVLILDDVSRWFVRAGRLVPATEVRRLVEAAADMHAAFDGVEIAELARLEDLLLLASPTTIATEAGADSPFLAAVEVGWSAFDDLVPVDVRGDQRSGGR